MDGVRFFPRNSSLPCFDASILARSSLRPLSSPLLSIASRIAGAARHMHDASVIADHALARPVLRAQFMVREKNGWKYGREGGRAVG